MMAYQYVVLRLVPRVDREEFINVGVVVYCEDAGFLDAAWDLDTERARVFAPDCDLDGVLGILEQVRAVCRGETGRGLPALDKPGQRFGWIIAPRSTAIQPGPVHGGLTSDPAAELQRLVTRLVGA